MDHPGTGHRSLMSVLLMVIWILAIAQASVKFSILSNIYLPSGEDGKLTFNSGAVNKIAFCPRGNRIYAAGNTMLHVIDVNNPHHPRVEYSRFEYGQNFVDVALCADRVFVTVDNLLEPTKGQLRVYSVIEDGFQLLAQTVVGVNPGNIVVREGCQSAVFTLRGNPYKNANGDLKDPEGEVLIANFEDGIVDNSSVTISRLGFKSFNDRYEDLEPYGVRFTSRGEGSTLSRDIVPEALVIDEFEDTAYVILQENNALANVDLMFGSVSDIQGFNYKRWGSFDASDRDTGPHVSYWPIRAWFQPGDVAFYEWNGMKLLFTANQGRARKDDVTKDITKEDLSDSMPEVVKNAIDDDTKLGRLSLSLKDGLDPETGKYEHLYTFGGRSFSIWDVSWGPLHKVFDSASDMEQITAQYCPHHYNRDVTPDDRSDDQGPEPESIAVRELNDRLYVLVGTKHPGTIFVYSLGKLDLTPSFETIYCGGIPEANSTLEAMYDQRQIFGVDPQDIKFIPENQSPTKRPLVIVVGAKSGTVTLLDFKIKEH